MKKILVIEDDPHVQEMYKKLLENIFPEASIVQCLTMNETKRAIQDTTYDLYLLDGKIIGGHTSVIIHSLPPEKVVVISADDDYLHEVEKKGIKTFTKPFGRPKFTENKGIFITIMGE